MNETGIKLISGNMKEGENMEELSQADLLTYSGGFWSFGCILGLNMLLSGVMIDINWHVKAGTAFIRWFCD